MKSDAQGPLVNCPRCGEPTRFGPQNRWRPFCSERCRMVDLGAWASDAYVLPGAVIESDDDLPEAASAPSRPPRDA